MPSRGTVFVHVPLSHTFTIQVAGEDGAPFYVSQAGRTCGLREGDVVVGLDGASIARWPLTLLQQCLKKASRDVVFEVLREMGDSAASVGVRADGAELGAATLNHHHHAVTKGVHEAEDLPVVSENGKIDESCVESPQGGPARPASPPASPPCSESMAPTAAPDTEAQTVTSSQTSHTRTSFESAVSQQGAGGGLQGSVQSQSVQNFSSQSQAIHSQSIQSAGVIQSQTTTTVNGQHSIQTASQSQNTSAISGQESIVDVSQSQSAQGVVQSDVLASALVAPVDQPRLEHPSVDENANSIPEEAPAHPEPAAVPESVAVQEVTTEAPEVQEPTTVPEPSSAPEPAEAPEPVVAPKPDVVQEPEAAPEPPVASIEAVTEGPAALPEPAVVQETADTQESAPPPESEPAPAPQEPAAPEPQPAAQTPEVPPAASPEPVPAPQTEPSRPESTPEVEPVTAPEPKPCAETSVSGGGSGGSRSVVEEISQEHIKEQLHEIITEIEQQVLPEQEQEQQQQEEVQQGGGGGGVAKRDTKPSEEARPVVGEDGRSLQAGEVEYYDEDGVLHHTWRPKGKYQVPKTVIQFEDVVPITVPDVAITLKAEPPKPAPPPPQPVPPQPEPQPTVEIHQEPQNLTNGAVSPIEIPAGIPLLARILPKDHEDGEKKMISLERLFTPATDSGDLTPKRSPSKKAFASSSFYRPDHPTIDDQVELAQRISFSLVDENNKMSRGQSMYMKRKKRSMRWIHAGGDNDEDAAGAGEGGEGQEEEQTLKHPPAAQRPASVPAGPQADTKKPPMKLLMSPKGVQDFHAVQEHYQALMDAIPTSPEVGKIVTEVQSPTGKGAELFAKRKKRMDKFIVDETTVQKAQTSATSTTTTTTRTQQQQQQQSIISTTNDLALKKSAVEERNRQQEQILEQFLRSREQSLTLVKSPWQAAMETGTPDAAFDDKRQKIKGTFHRPGSSERPELANTVCERADTKLAQAAPWLEPPKSVPLVAAPLSAEVTPMAAPPPTGSFTLPDLTKILTQPSKPKSSEPKVEPNKPKPVPPKPKSWQSVNRTGSGDSPTPAPRGGSQRTPASPAFTSPPPHHSVCSPKPLPLPPPRFRNPPQPVSPASDPTCRINKSQTTTHSIGSRGFASPKLAVGAASPSVTPSPAPASMTASGAFDRSPARPVAFPKPVSAVVSPGMRHFVVSTSRTSSVESPKHEPTKFHTSPSSTSLATPSSVPQRLIHDAECSVPTSSGLASLPVAGCGGGAFKPTLKSDSGRPNSVPLYPPASSPSLPSTSGVSPTTFSSHNNDPTSSQNTVNKEQELKPGTPPVYVFPDGTEAAYLTENALNHHFENSIQVETRDEYCTVPIDDSTSPAAVRSLAHDISTALDPRGLNPEVSRHAEGTPLTTRSDNLSTCLSDSTDTNSCHHENNVCNIDNTTKVSSIHSSARPARPTSLPLISLSSLVNNISFASPTSFPCNPASSPSVSAAYPTARSFSDIALPQNPISSDISFPCVVAADPCVGPQVGGVSALTAASSPSLTLPGPSSTPPSHAATVPDPTFLVSQHIDACSRHTDASSPLEHECKIQPSVMNPIEAFSENHSALRKVRQDFKVDPSSESSHVSESKEVKLPLAPGHGEKLDSSFKRNEDGIINVSGKPLPQARESFSVHDEDHESEDVASNFSHGIPLIEISDVPRKSSLDEEELRKFMEEMKLSFQNAPSAIDNINIEDLKPPDFYRSVSRSSMDQELEDLDVTVATSDYLAETSARNLGGNSVPLVQAIDDGDKKMPVESPHCEERGTSQKQGNDGTEVVESVVSQAEAVVEDSAKDAADVQPEEEEEEEEDDEGEGSGYAGDMRPRLSFQNCMVFTRRCSFPTNESPSPPLSSPSTSTNPPTPSAGPAAIYTAEVKVVQRSSLPPTPAPDVPRSMLSQTDQDSKRNSLNFNLAAKGWGTYSNFYSPVTFAT